MKIGSSDGMTFENWLVAHSKRFSDLYEYAKSPLPTDIGERQMDVEKAIRCGDDTSRLLADACSFLTMHTAQAVLSVKEAHKELTADERKLLVKDAVRKIQRIVDGLAVTERSIKDRIYAAFSANRARMI